MAVELVEPSELEELDKSGVVDIDVVGLAVDSQAPTESGPVGGTAPTAAVAGSPPFTGTTATWVAGVDVAWFDECRRAGAELV
jgi:hypothetical protein